MKNKKFVSKLKMAKVKNCKICPISEFWSSVFRIEIDAAKERSNVDED